MVATEQSDRTRLMGHSGSLTIPSLTIGPYRVHFVSGGRFRLDGGAMFGVVPKALWSRVAPADEMNRIRMAMNCLLIEGGGKRVLVKSALPNSGSKSNPTARFRPAFSNGKFTIPATRPPSRRWCKRA